MELTWSGRLKWEDYIREALRRRRIPAAEVTRPKHLAAWQARMETAARTASCARGCSPGMFVELALAEPQAPAGGGSRALPQVAVVADRWRHLGLKTKLATFLERSGAQHLCPEQVVVHTPADIPPELAARMSPEQPW